MDVRGGVTKKNRTARGRPFKSRYYGECAVCNSFFDPGHMIVRLLTGYYRVEEIESNNPNVGPGSNRIDRWYAHKGCAVQPPTKPTWLPDRYQWCTVCDDWWDMSGVGACKHSQPWDEGAKRKRWRKEHDN